MTRRIDCLMTMTVMMMSTLKSRNSLKAKRAKRYIIILFCFIHIYLPTLLNIFILSLESWPCTHYTHKIFKVLDLQSRYKSDKRFILDERFVEDGPSEEEAQGQEEKPDGNERIDLKEADEKTKQLNILQDVLGVSIKARPNDNDSHKTK